MKADGEIEKEGEEEVVVVVLKDVEVSERVSGRVSSFVSVLEPGKYW